MMVSSLLVVLTLALLIGCGGSPNRTTSNTPAPSPPSGTTPPPTGSGGGNPATCPTVASVQAKGPTTGVADFPAPAPEPPPTPGANAAGSVCVSQPNDGASVTSPARVVAAASLGNPIDHMRVFVDGQAVFFTFYNTMDAQIWMSAGQHNVEVLATDKNGGQASTSFNVNVTGPGNTVISDIQNMPNWEPCSAVFPPGHPRAGQICAAGLGTAASTMTENQSSPSLSGSSAKFTMGGPQPYTNELYTKFLGGGTAPTHFVYDMFFMIDHPDVVQALEFDVNQTFGNRRWVFGTECNFKDSLHWDVWDGVKGWQPTSIPCNAFPANQWIHLVWTFERVGEQVHYISLQIDNDVHPLNLFFSNQPNWTMEDIDVAFQMDGDFRQDPYTVWLDKVTLTAF